MQIEKYRKKLSGPILDRIDLHVFVQEVQVEKLVKNTPGHQTSLELRQLVDEARKRQAVRYQDTTFITNSELSSQAVKQYCKLTKPAQEILHLGMNKLQLSARSYFKMIKVAQTIADLEGTEDIQDHHMSEAFQYRPQMSI